MRVGILGSGLMGGKLGTIFARAGHEVVFSYARSNEKLNKLAREAKGKARAGSPREAAQDADAVLLAVHWSRFDDVLKQAGDLSGKVVITCSLPMNVGDTELVVARTSSGAEELAKRIPKARVVCAFNTVPSEVLFDVFDAKRKRHDQAWCIAATIRAPRMWLLSLFGMPASIPWMVARCGSRGTWSHSRCWWRNSHTREKTDQSWRIASSGLEDEP
jgi:predicted dinucleotide-binding enzyme